MGDSLNFLDKRISTLLGELSGEKTKLEAILKNLSNGVVVLYLDGTLIHVNRVAKKILGIDNDDIENKKYDDIIKYFSQELLLEKIKCVENLILTKKNSKSFELLLKKFHNKIYLYFFIIYLSFGVSITSSISKPKIGRAHV